MQLERNKELVAISKVGHCIHVNAIYWFVRGYCRGARCN
ncbi:hypothetical protein vBAspATola_50 [Aeromonas phage vB_AspA_Tola]|nr:hypothetical protein vBAspATola_50 [Aeromonas phage vB_AspA_Tola]